MVDTLKSSETAQLTRGQRLWEQALEARGTTISLWRARLLTASWKETEGLPQQIKKAKAFEKIVTEIPIFIPDEQLLAGDLGAWLQAGEWYPEGCVTRERRELAAGRPPYGLDEKEVAEFGEILEYWDTRNSRDSFMASLDDAERQRIDEIAEEGACVYQMYAEITSDKSWHCPDYERAITKGFLGLLAEVEEELKATKVRDHQSRDKAHLLKGMVIVLKAGILYAKRYSALARELAKNAKGARKQELEKLAEICDWVPANPARTFHEAFQSMWFAHVMGLIDTVASARAPGRVDQYLYPYYRKDVDEGRLTQEEAISLIECFRVKLNAFRRFETVYSHKANDGEAQFQNCTLGGQTPDGKDATNELSFLWLEAAFRVRSPHPTLSIRWHENLNPEFAIRAAELSRLGLGYPAWFGDKANMAYCMGPRMGATLEEARNYQLSGCVLSTIPGKTIPTWPIIINMGKTFELALYDGFDPTTGKQWGPRTGRFEDMSSWDELYPAFKEQVRFFITESSDILNRTRMYRSQLLPQVYMSLFFDDCVKRGEDTYASGVRYQGSGMYLLPVGLMDAVDSLAAIKKVVFDDGKISKEDLLEALGANFEGYEDIRQMLLSAPKYGNDDDYVDSIAAEMYKLLVDVCDNTDACYGEKYVCAPHTIAIQARHGKRVGALPSGRLASLSLADGAVSPSQGMDYEGPTATMNSAGKIDQDPLFGVLFNMKFHPSALATREDLQKLLGMIKTYFDAYGGKHIQFNVVSKATLLDAQAHPEKYRNLVVRVAGYSALWVELDRTLQDEIIARSEKGW